MALKCALKRGGGHVDAGRGGNHLADPECDGEEGEECVDPTDGGAVL